MQGSYNHSSKHQPSTEPQPAPEEPPATAPESESPIATESSESVEAVSLPANSEVTIPPSARYVSASSGNDSNSGSAEAPWRTLSKAVSSVVAGDVVVLEPGTYGAVGTTTTFGQSGSSSAPIVFTSAPRSEPAVIRGYIRVTGSHMRLDSLIFDGPTGTVVPKSTTNPQGEQVQVSIMYGTDVALTNSVVRDNSWHAGVFVSKATDVRILSNHIRDNGDAATGANLDHGIYWCSGSGVVRNNWIEDNVAWGVHLYPDATDVIVSHNTITGNGRGGVIVARESSGNQLLNNVVANNNGYGIRAYELTGSNNVARDNLVWNNGQNTYGTGISFSGTVVADPSTSGDTLSEYGASAP
jgi:parallel beta-helix repeat protein